MWCKPGQYLDHKNCICKNESIGRLIEKCTRVINETMINNKGNIDNNNTIWNVFIGLFSIVILIGVTCLCVIIFKCIKSEKYSKINILKILYTLIKMVIKSFKIKKTILLLLE